MDGMNTWMNAMDTWMKTWMKHMDVMRHTDEHMDETHGYGDMDGMNTVATEWWPSIATTSPNT